MTRHTLYVNQWYTNYMNYDEVCCLMVVKINHYGSQQKAARAWNISSQYLSDVLNGRRPIGKRILDALGLETRTTYHHKGEE